jgi:hypothetical protein
MFLHIGQDEIVPLDEIVSILNVRGHLGDKKNSWINGHNGKENHSCDAKVKSIIIMNNGEIYFSHIGAETLIKRITKTQSAQRSGVLKY